MHQKRASSDAQYLLEAFFNRSTIIIFLGVLLVFFHCGLVGAGCSKRASYNHMNIVLGCSLCRLWSTIIPVGQLMCTVFTSVLGSQSQEWLVVRLSNRCWNPHNEEGGRGLHEKQICQDQNELSVMIVYYSMIILREAGRRRNVDQERLSVRVYGRVQVYDPSSARMYPITTWRHGLLHNSMMCLIPVAWTSGVQ